MLSSIQAIDGHYRTIFLTFVLSKAVLLAIAAGSQIGPPYDTSTNLLALDLSPTASAVADANSSSNANASLGRHLVTRLTSWDAIYFLKVAERGYLFEQEWAFGSALPTCIFLLNRALSSLGVLGPSLVDPALVLPLLGVAIANACHLLSAFVLYQLGLNVGTDATWALVAALLHLLSPAGLFLVAPYQESPFALLSFLGWWLLVKSCATKPPSGFSSDALTLLAAVSFGFATLFRSNGLLNGIPLALDFLRTLYNLVEDVGPGTESARVSTVARSRRLIILGLSGLTVAAGSFVPQFLAYNMYCTGLANDQESVRTWCLKLVPSIYGFVQKHYWNTGLFRYWTLSNLPLFLLAAPMLFVMAKSGKDMFLQAPILASQKQSRPQQQQQQLSLMVKSMALAQILIALLTFTSYHVQIITRLSSGYPAWYWWVAACIRNPKTQGMGKGLVTFSVMYACIQAVLFASFLPPA